MPSLITGKTRQQHLAARAEMKKKKYTSTTAHPFSVSERIGQIKERKKQTADILAEMDGTQKKKKSKVATPY